MSANLSIPMVAGGLSQNRVNWVLVGQSAINIYGARPLVTLCSYGIMCAMNLFFMNRAWSGSPLCGGCFCAPLHSEPHRWAAPPGGSIRRCTLFAVSLIAYERLAMAVP
jgi:hypothetical protein